MEVLECGQRRFPVRLPKRHRLKVAAIALPEHYAPVAIAVPDNIQQPVTGEFPGEHWPMAFGIGERLRIPDHARTVHGPVGAQAQGVIDQQQVAAPVTIDISAGRRPAGLRVDLPAWRVIGEGDAAEISDAAVGPPAIAMSRMRVTGRPPGRPGLDAHSVLLLRNFATLTPRARRDGLRPAPVVRR